MKGYAYRRLVKYRRKKLRKLNPHDSNRLFMLYWRYHLKVYGPAQLLWA